MFEQPTKLDIDRALSTLKHEARRQVADQRNQIMSDATKRGALHSNRVIVIIADAADKVHAASSSQAKQILIDFIQRMGTSAGKVAGWAQPHLDDLSEAV